MSRRYAEYEGKFALYSETHEAFITNLMSLEELDKLYKTEYGEHAVRIDRIERIDFDVAIFNWANSQPLNDDVFNVVRWLKRNNVNRRFEFKCYLDKDNFYICQEEGK